MNGISIIICTYNGKQKLEETLLAILRLKATFSWELLVIDNASTDGTSEFASSLLNNSGIDWKILHENKPGLIKARLCGLKASKYDVLLYCDDDNTLDENYLQIGYDLLNQNPSIGALGGCGTPVFEAQKPDWFDKYGHSFAVGPQAENDGPMSEYPAELYGAGAFFRKEVLLQFIEKGFKSGLSGRTGNNLVSGEDVEWCYLIQLAGYQIWYDHRLVFTHAMPQGRMNWEYYLRLKQGIASGAGQLLPYSCLFKNKKMNNFEYFSNWFKRAFSSTLLYYKFSFSQLLKRKSLNAEERLGKIILKAKMKSYFKNAIPAYYHFVKIKTII
jgi:glycosyltransferase involved in cell wall biosynthesis